MSTMPLKIFTIPITNVRWKIKGLMSQSHFPRGHWSNRRVPVIWHYTFNKVAHWKRDLLLYAEICIGIRRCSNFTSTKSHTTAHWSIFRRQNHGRLFWGKTRGRHTVQKIVYPHLVNIRIFCIRIRFGLPISLFVILRISVIHLYNEIGMCLYSQCQAMKQWYAMYAI